MGDLGLDETVLDEILLRTMHAMTNDVFHGMYALQGVAGSRRKRADENIEPTSSKFRTFLSTFIPPPYQCKLSKNMETRKKQRNAATATPRSFLHVSHMSVQCVHWPCSSSCVAFAKCSLALESLR